ncbi:hypothetical protein [Mycolicibacterium mageritense]|uniref:Uncharacterized protein n=1 Tax=Mycolicibacterium mageritense TaxID=53462 RepID=A0ABM7I6E8_MYCME|nr:hypothetical protein [Mycolicibacterium mageritense]BBX35978.1 hypothetical protein MMAGJ_52600 [Mycolicibacterium mageritense]BBX38526.1 hypothetical protein MMAGJ_78080 [Mycolicibacterium mageritense]CDO24098.1 hypothetical protein BN978_04590 [Mycolicibacterium mageritense DSM 44476 = CIP 104973]
MSGHENPCPETEALLAKLDAAGVECEVVSLAEVVESDMPLFFYPKDFTGGGAA